MLLASTLNSTYGPTKKLPEGIAGDVPMRGSGCLERCPCGTFLKPYRRKAYVLHLRWTLFVQCQQSIDYRHDLHAFHIVARATTDRDPCGFLT